MKLLLVGPDQHNATDGCIVRGIMNLIHKTFEGKEHLLTSIQYIRLENDIPQNIKADLSYRDYIVVCGTPWLWDSFQNSVKYNNLLQLFNSTPQVRKIFMGAGTCVPLKASEEILNRPEERGGMYRLFSQATTIVRDSLAQETLKKAGVKSHLLPCPAFFCYGDANISRTARYEDVLIWTDPTKTISASDWTDPERLREYYNVALNFYSRYGASVYCTDQRDIEKAISIGLPPPILLNSWRDTMGLMLKARRVLSGRVHCAIPAVASDTQEVDIMPIDSRHKAFTEFKRADLGLGKYKYLSILSGALGVPR